MEHLVYILYAEKHDKIYVGYTTDLINRMASHNTFAKTGYTLKYRPWKVIHVEFMAQQTVALKREKQLKGGQGSDCWILKKTNQHFPLLLCYPHFRTGFLLASKLQGNMGLAIS